MLETPTRAFVQEVSPNLEYSERHLVSNVFFPTHHYLNTTMSMTNSTPPCPHGSKTTTSTLATPNGIRPQRPSHGYLDHDYTMLPYRLHRGTKGYRLA